MKHYMVGISGFSGSGKDTVANALIGGFDAVRIGCADPAKRHMADLYGFTEEQLFGPSEKRNAGDLRYPKHSNLILIKRNHTEIGDTFFDYDLVSERVALDPNATYYSFCEHRSSESIQYNLPYEVVNTNKRVYYVIEGDPNFWLSPREALQKYCELMNTMYLDTWIRKSIETQIQLAAEYPKYSYSNMHGLVNVEYPLDTRNTYLVTCSPDFRHKHEVKLIREYEKGDTISVLIRVKRPSIPKPPYQHRSEIEQTTIPDSEFDFVLDNCGTIDELDVKTKQAMRCILESGHPQTTVYL